MSLLSGLSNICFNILDSSAVMDITDNASDSVVSSIDDGDWSYLFMPEPFAGGSENIGTVYS